eukprot:gene158-185_t
MSTATGVYRAYVGTYHPNGEGVYVFDVDQVTGAFSNRRLVGKVKSPAQLAMDSRFKTLYAASAVDNMGTNGDHGVITSFAVGEDGDLTMLNEVDSGGSRPCYIECAKDDRHVFVANYGCGSVAVFPVSNRMLLPASSVVAFPGRGTSHAHMFTASPLSDRFLYATDKGMSNLYLFVLDGATSTIVPNPEQRSVVVNQGSGPRHIAFHPSGGYAYIIQEDASTVSSYIIDKTTGIVSIQDTISSVALNYNGKSLASGITISRDGRFLYAANRFRNTIALISIDQLVPSSIKLVEEIWTRGDHIRTVTLDPTGGFLYAANERSDNITRFSINPNNGHLMFIDDYIGVGSPSQIVFAYSIDRD